MKKDIHKIGAVAIALFLLGALFFAPVSSAPLKKELENNVVRTPTPKTPQLDTAQQPFSKITQFLEDSGPFVLDRTYVLEDPAPLSRTDNDDAGYKRDAGDEILRAAAIYPGEMVDDWPGRGVTGKLSVTDDEDWYFFSVCTGQTIQISMTPSTGYDFDIGLWDNDGVERANSTNAGSTPESISYVVDYTGRWYFQILFISGPSQGSYTFGVDIVGQNDASSGNDAGDDFASATLIEEGVHEGYLDMNDEEDWYKFQVDAGDGIHFTLKMSNLAYLSDFDIALFNPSGEKVHEENYYYDDELWYPADVSGQWRARIDIFPGYTDIPQPTEWDYWTYGSGAYSLTFVLEADAPLPPPPIPQPDITPITHTFTINNNPDSNADEYGYLASIPACNYLEDGNRHLAPILYAGDDTPTNWFGDVDDTTSYLLEDWNAYLAEAGKTAIEYIVPADPIQAAAQIATSCWSASDLAVIAVDGSVYEDTTKELVSKTRTLRRNVEVETVPSDSPDILDIGGTYVYPIVLGPKWGAINVSIEGGITEPSLTELYPKYMNLVNDWWPEHEEKYDIYYPVTTMGFWSASAGSIAQSWDFKITKYEGDRYHFNVKNADSALKATLTTSSASDLLVFLVDPQGHIRAPDIPDWNGGDINPIHEWNGIDNGDPSTSCKPFRGWNPAPHTEFTAEVLHPETGWWTAIVVPRNAEGAASVQYTITVEQKDLNEKRVNAAISAANAAVIASLEHAPLLFVTEDEVPTVTENALTTLGVNHVIFVERGEIGSAVRADLPTIDADLTTMKDIVDYIKEYDASENYITITSLKTGDGYFAPATMLAAYHGSPVMRIEEASDEISGSSSVSYVVVVMQGSNVCVMDPQTNEVLYSNPAGWTPEQTGVSPQGAETTYVGSTQNTVFFFNADTGELVFSYDPKLETVGIEDAGQGSLFLDMEAQQLYIVDDNSGDEIGALPLFGSGPVNPAGMANRIDTWRLWGGDYYHGNRAPGHLPIHDEPIEDQSNLDLLVDLLRFLVIGEGELPPLGRDAKRYWNEEMHDGIHDWISEYNLDLDGQEAYAFVAPRKDIRLEAHSVMIGNNSYAGHIPGDTPAYTSAIIVRELLYPAIIYANPNRDVTTTQMMNWPDGGTWRTNDGEMHQVYSTRVIKQAFMSHNRIYDGHCLWDAHLERMNDGASVFYYSGHGTGGSGISSQYIQTSYSNYPDQVWFDAWRGYMYDNWKMPRDNGQRWYNPEPPNLYDIIHYKWVDQLLENLKSNAVFYMSCSTAQQFGPTVYLDHGALLWYGNAGSGLCPEADLQDDEFFKDAMIYGEPIGAAYSKQVWLHFRDFTTKDPTSMYGSSSLYGTEGITTIQCIYGDPNLILYSPEWSMPAAIESPLSGKLNNPPNTPTITGPQNGEVGTEYTYTFCATDPDGDDVFYCIDWGDGSGEICIGPYPSGTCVESSHIWAEQGTYLIKAKARDTNQAESGWGTLSVTMPTNHVQSTTHPFLKVILGAIEFVKGAVLQG